VPDVILTLLPISTLDAASSETVTVLFDTTIDAPTAPPAPFTVQLPWPVLPLCWIEFDVPMVTVSAATIVVPSAISTIDVAEVSKRAMVPPTPATNPMFVESTAMS
jgi:hypothetical protein